MITPWLTAEDVNQMPMGSALPRLLYQLLNAYYERYFAAFASTHDGFSSPVAEPGRELSGWDAGYHPFFVGPRTSVLQATWLTRPRLGDLFRMPINGGNPPHWAPPLTLEQWKDRITGRVAEGGGGQTGSLSGNINLLRIYLSELVETRPIVEESYRVSIPVPGGTRYFFGKPMFLQEGYSAWPNVRALLTQAGYPDGWISITAQRAACSTTATLEAWVQMQRVIERLRWTGKWNVDPNSSPRGYHATFEPVDAAGGYSWPFWDP